VQHLAEHGGGLPPHLGAAHPEPREEVPHALLPPPLRFIPSLPPPALWPSHGLCTPSRSRLSVDAHAFPPPLGDGYRSEPPHPSPSPAALLRSRPEPPPTTRPSCASPHLQPRVPATATALARRRRLSAAVLAHRRRRLAAALAH
jgi:hypothetical protein